MATLSVTVPDGAVSRIRNAVGVVNQLPQPATLAQVGEQVRAYLRGLCLQVEAQQQTDAALNGAAAAVAAEFPPE